MIYSDLRSEVVLGTVWKYGQQLPEACQAHGQSEIHSTSVDFTFSTNSPFQIALSQVTPSSPPLLHPSSSSPGCSLWTLTPVTFELPWSGSQAHPAPPDLRTA